MTTITPTKVRTDPLPQPRPREPSGRFTTRLEPLPEGLRRLSNDPGYQAIHRADTTLRTLQASLKRELGADSEAVAFVGDAREALFEAAHKYAEEQAPKVTGYLRNAVQRSIARRAAV